MEQILRDFKWLLGIGVEDLNTLQMVLRSVVIYGTAIVLVRLGDKRFLGKSSAMDVILGIILGSVLSRAINGKAPLLPTLGASFALVSLHWIFAALSFHSEWFGDLVKGRPHQIIKDGKLDWENMRGSHISKKDLLEEVRLKAKTTELDSIGQAYFERNGNLSFISKENAPQVLDVKVEDGVQVVRIKLG